MWTAPTDCSRMANSHSRVQRSDEDLQKHYRRNDIFVRCPNGKTLSMSLSPEDRLSVIQAYVYNQTGVRSSDQVLQCNTKPLFHDRSTIEECGIVDRSTVFVSTRTRGGCFMISFSILIVIAVACLLSFCTCGMSLCIVPFLLPLLCILPLFCL